MRGGRRGAEGVRRRSRRQRPEAVDRLTERIHDPAEPAFRRPDRGRGGRHDGAAAAPDPVERRERQGPCVPAGEADGFAGKAAAGPRLDGQTGADRHGVDRSGHLNHAAAHADDASVDLDAIDIADLLGQRLHL